ncbi:HAUS augmin-like complex subunit 6 N-terminus [Teratosphaeria destructans]|uniref:HAUS augmin-like complex subunit 6 N-terminus n=1 Tax=Teratosphaeria destructans TaxID=418781 RepID=A0A9W7SIX4_9PEZI|nr:HAUS augmin-like complex subunit 6 N-terminus [Teratosphaeria destructans]
MERPVSSASNTSTRPSAHTRNPSTTSLHTHHHPPKKSSLTSAVIALFHTNLRLLDLDLLPDWPDVHLTSFAAHDARHRIRCVEFALFHLFRLYDAPTAADKLQPFYPPLEPVQSLNLRAALYRCLNELKKTGALGKETVLRKTMLDECHGDKFWEVCLAFSAAVLKKVTLDKSRRGDRHVPLAESFGVAAGLSVEQKASLLPLAIAHRASLAKVLDEKERKRETIGRLYHVLLEKEAELERRKMQVIEKAQASPSDAQLERLSVVGHTLDKRWVGSKVLRKTLVDGDATGSAGHVLTLPIDQLADASQDVQQPTGLLGSLERSAALQAQRVRRWQSMHQELLAKKPASRQTAKSDHDRSVPQFDRHKSLSLRDASPPTQSPPQQHRPAPSSSITRYDEILIAMRDDLRRNCKTAAAPRSGPPQNTPRRPQPIPRKPSIHIDTSAGAADPHRRSLSHTAVPVRPRMGRRSSSRSKSYAAPKVEGQRGLVPLKAELFSPLKTGTRSSTSPLSVSTGPLVESPVSESPAPQRDHRAKTDSGISFGLGISDLNIKRASVVDVPTSAPIISHREQESRSSMDDMLAAAAEEVGQDRERERVKDASRQGLIIPRTDMEHRASIYAARPSLAERTRMSMAPRVQGSEESIQHPPSETSSMPTPEQTSTSTSPATAVSEDADKPDEISALANAKPLKRTSTLLERTRQSISLAPQHHQPPKKLTHKRSRTSVYQPHKPFDTPVRKNRANSTAAQATPILEKEELFSPDADYDSIFRARPRLMHSPQMSPVADPGLNAMSGVVELEH